MSGSSWSFHWQKGSTGILRVPGSSPATQKSLQHVHCHWAQPPSPFGEALFSIISLLECKNHFGIDCVYLLTLLYFLVNSVTEEIQNGLLCLLPTDKAARRRWRGAFSLFLWFIQPAGRSPFAKCTVEHKAKVIKIDG